MTELQPCPKCRSARMAARNGTQHFFVICKCRGNFGLMFGTEAEALRAWNLAPGPKSDAEKQKVTARERVRDEPKLSASDIKDDPFYELPSEKALKQACVLADVQFTTANMLIRGGNADPGFVRALYALARKIDEESQVHSASGTDEALVEELAIAINNVHGEVNYDYMDFCRDSARAILPIIRRERDAAFAAGEAKERADVVAWLRRTTDPREQYGAYTARDVALEWAMDIIESGEHKETNNG